MPTPTPRALNAALELQAAVDPLDMTAHELALAFDRFAAQRGAEAPPGGPIIWGPRGSGEGIGTGANLPPQTGGGDAPRYRVEGGEVVDTKTGKREPIIEHQTQTGGGDAGRSLDDVLDNPAVPNEALRNLLTTPAPWESGGDAGERARALYLAVICEHIDAPITEAKVIIPAIEAALRDSHREGAEAMRLADARACSERGAWAEAKIANDSNGRWETYSNACDDCAEIVGALPIPGTEGKRT